jgi:hypothetical protein
MNKLILSAQEARIKLEIERSNDGLEGKNRAYRILKKIREDKPQIDVERG